MLPSELAKPQSYLGVPWFCLECIGLMLSSVGLQWCSGHGALMISCRPSIALSSCSPGETRTNINYVGSRMVSICMYIYIQVSMLYSQFPEHLSLTTQNTPRIVQSFHPIFDPIFLFLQSDLPPATGHRYRYLPPILPRQLERLFFPFVPI